MKRKTSLTIALFLLWAFLVVPLDAQTFAYTSDESNGTWAIHTSMPTPRAGLRAAVVDGKIYAIGGTNASGHDPNGASGLLFGKNIVGFIGTNEEYDPATGNWTTKADMPTPRILFAIAVYQNKIYCFGGRNAYYNGNYLNTTEVYDPQTNTWTTKTDMPTPRSCIQANIVNDKIYIIGGEPNGNLNQIYNPQTDTWTNSTPPTNPAILYQSTTLDNKIYIISGYPQKPNQIYNPTIDQWSISVPPPRYIMGGAVVATTGESALKRLYLFGYTSNYVYNPAIDNWTENSRPLNRVYFAAVNVDDTVYIIGGYSYTFTYEWPFGEFAPLSTNEQFTPAEYGTPDPSYQPPTPTPTPTPNTTQTPTPQPTNTTQPTQTNQQTTTPTPTTTPNNLDFWQTTTLWTTTTITIAAAASIAAIIVLLKKQHKTPSDTLARLSTPTIKQQI